VALDTVLEIFASGRGGTARRRHAVFGKGDIRENAKTTGSGAAPSTLTGPDQSRAKSLLENRTARFSLLLLIIPGQAPSTRMLFRSRSRIPNKTPGTPPSRATSSGLPASSGECFRSPVHLDGIIQQFCVDVVSMAPGAMLLMVMPSGASSIERLRVHIFTPLTGALGSEMRERELFMHGAGVDDFAGWFFFRLLGPHAGASRPPGNEKTPFRLTLRTRGVVIFFSSVQNRRGARARRC